MLRTSGTDGYNSYLYGMGGLNSVTTVLCNNAACANEAVVVNLVKTAAAIFFAGGDQSTYYTWWKNTPLSAALQDAVSNRNVPIGGTSAGEMVLGELIYTALYNSATSPTALANPYNSDMTFGSSLVDLNPTKGVVMDSHFYERDRMGRLLAFMARLVQDGTTPVRVVGVGVDEETAIGVSANGDSTLFGNGYVYIMQGTIAPSVCRQNSPLTYNSISALRLDPLQATHKFNFVSRTGTGKSYSVSVVNGVITSDPYSVTPLERKQRKQQQQNQQQQPQIDVLIGASRVCIDVAGLVAFRVGVSCNGGASNDSPTVALATHMVGPRGPPANASLFHGDDGSIGLRAPFGSVSILPSTGVLTLWDVDGQVLTKQPLLQQQQLSTKLYFSTKKGGRVYGYGGGKDDAGVGGDPFAANSASAMVGNTVWVVPSFWTTDGYSALGVSSLPHSGPDKSLAKYPASWERHEGNSTLVWSFDGSSRADLYLMPASTATGGVAAITSLAGGYAKPPRYAFGPTHAQTL